VARPPPARVSASAFPRPGRLSEAIEELKKAIREEKLNKIQFWLDVAGTFDPFGICDAVNAGISYARGDYVGAGFNLVGAIPLIGNVLGHGLKAASKFGRVLDLGGGVVRRTASKIIAKGRVLKCRILTKLTDIPSCFVAGTQVIVVENGDLIVTGAMSEEMPNGGWNRNYLMLGALGLTLAVVSTPLLRRRKKGEQGAAEDDLAWAEDEGWVFESDLLMSPAGRVA
jgi:hypothetical protein